MIDAKFLYIKMEESVYVQSINLSLELHSLDYFLSLIYFLRLQSYLLTYT